MQFSFVLTLLAGLVSETTALRCGTLLTTDCVSSGDIRYDHGYSNDLLKQHPIWEKTNGLGRMTSTTRDPNGTPIYAVPYDIVTGKYGIGPLTNLVDGRFFFNKTIIGSRSYQHVYVFTPPVPLELCQGGPPPGIFNAGIFNESEAKGPPNGVSDEICGVNGRLILGDNWGASTYDKDATLRDFKGLGWWNAITVTLRKPIDSRTMYIYSRDHIEGEGAEVQFSGDHIFYDNFKKQVYSTSLYLFGTGFPFQSHTSSVLEKIEGGNKQFVKEIEEAMDEFNIPMSQRVPIPMTTECLHPLECATEEEFCTIGKDPNCSESPYQEPAASLNGGAITLVVILCLAATTVVFYIIYQQSRAKQKKRYRDHFIRSIAKHIHIEPTANMTSPENLKKEFDKIDTDEGGTISKEELQVFTDSGMIGNLSKKDFSAMWSALDLDNSGEIDFVEFTVFLSSCGDEFDKVNKEQDVMTKAEKLNFASKRLSVRDLSAINQSADTGTDDNNAASQTKIQLYQHLELLGDMK